MDKPFLKWAGRKTQLVDTIVPLLDGSKILVEPFSGSGAIALNASNAVITLNDMNSDLISVFSYLASDENFIKYTQKLFMQYNLTNFYTIRDEFNTTKNKRRKAALFVWLNRHCFNGLCRYNLAGDFNVPVGKYDTIYFPEKEMKLTREMLTNKTVNLSDMSFEFVMLNAIGTNSVVYCDPPYIPISVTSSFTSYVSNEFTIYHQRLLAGMAKLLSIKGITTIISNSKCELTENIYSDADSFEIVTVNRSIGSKTESRGSIEEYLIIYNGVTDE